MIPFRAGAAVLNWVYRRGPGGAREPNWKVSDRELGYPAMALNISSPFQRRAYFFPRAYWRRLMSLHFGRFIDATLKPGQVFLDVGSNIGYYTLFAADRVGASGGVVAFEPEPVTYESVLRSARANAFSNVRCVHAALSDRQDRLAFYQTEDGSAHSLVPEVKGRENRYSATVNVPVTSLDHMLANGELELTRIDLIKVDVEGEEARTVAGMVTSLAHFAYPDVWAEVRGPNGSTRAPNTYPAVAKVLCGLGYKPLRWSESGCDAVPDSGIDGREDVLFRHPSRAQMES